jgi:hypothetical protein
MMNFWKNDEKVKFLLEVYEDKKRVFQSVIYETYDEAVDTVKIETTRNGGDKGILFRYLAAVPCFIY